MQVYHDDVFTVNKLENQNDPNESGHDDDIAFMCWLQNFRNRNRDKNKYCRFILGNRRIPLTTLDKKRRVYQNLSPNYRQYLHTEVTTSSIRLLRKKWSFSSISARSSVLCVNDFFLFLITCIIFIKSYMCELKISRVLSDNIDDLSKKIISIKNKKF